MMNCHSSGIIGRSAISHFLNFSSYISAFARETRCPTHQDTIYPLPSIYPSFLSVTPRAFASATPTLGFSAITNCILNHSFRFEIKRAYRVVSSYVKYAILLSQKMRIIINNRNIFIITQIISYHMFNQQPLFSVFYTGYRYDNNDKIVPLLIYSLDDFS